jgi:hypothetical protein
VVKKLELLNAEIIELNEENSTCNILLTFPYNPVAIQNRRRAILFCRIETGEVTAYNIGIMDGTCPCCLKPTCSSFFAKRHELLKEAQEFIDFSSKLVNY